MEKKPWEEDYEKKPWEDDYSEEEPGSEGITGRGLLKGALQTLPTAGAMVGGAVGTVGAPGIGTLAGAGLGAGLGKAAQNLGERFLLDEPKTREEIYVEPATETIAGAAAEGAGQLIAPALRGAGKLVKKAASSFSQIPEKTLETYFKRGKDVEGLIAKHGDNTQESANALREKINQSVNAFKSKQNAAITRTLENKTDVVDISDALKELRDIQAKLDPDFDIGKIDLIQKQIDSLSKAAPQGQLPLKRAYAAKQALQDAADYLEPGQFFKKKGIADIAIERAARSINNQIKAVAPEIKAADKNLSELRRATKNLNRNLLKEGATEASLIQAAGGNNQNALALKRIEGLIGKDIVPEIENIAAQKAFADPTLLPNVSTGAKLVPLILGGGYAGREAMEGDYTGAAQGLLAASLGSPLALKYGIQAARPLIRSGGYLLPLLKETPKGLLAR